MVSWRERKKYQVIFLSLLNLNKKVSFIAHVGFAGWKSVKYDGASKDSHAWGVDLDGNNVTFGVNYNF